MKRVALTIVLFCTMAVSSQAEPPAGPGPKLAIAAVAKNGDIVIDDTAIESAYETQTRTIEENGVRKTVQVAVPVRRFVTVKHSYAAKGVTAFDSDGREILPSRLATMLREPRAVAISEVGGKLPSAFRAALRDDVIVLVLPPPPEPIPPPPP